MPTKFSIEAQPDLSNAWTPDSKRPPNESELHEYHVKQGHTGKLDDCQQCEKVLGNATQPICKCGHMDDQHMSGGECEKCDCSGYRRGGTVENSNGWPLSMKCSFIEPGIVRYADVGDVFVTKAVLDKMANSFVGKPVINEDHRDVSPADFEKGTAQGIVNTVWFDNTDAMYHAGYQVWDQSTLRNIKSGYKVSCAYKVTRWGNGGVHNNVPYEREVLDGEYTHLAIVANPRYEGVRIYNAKGAKTMTLKWIQKLFKDGKELENSVDIESSKSVVQIEGKDVPMDDLVNAFNEAEEAKKKAALENAVPKDTDLIDIGGGKKVMVGDLRKAYQAKNASEKEAEEKAKAAKEKEEEDRKNAAEKTQLAADHAAGKHTEHLTNCVECIELKNKAGAGHFERVEAARREHQDDLMNDLDAPFDGFAEGRKRFGSEPATAAKK